MKFLLLVFIFAISAFGAIENVGRSASLKFDKTVQNPEKEFINVKNVSGGSLAIGQAVVIDLTEDDGASVNTIGAVDDAPICILVEACADDALCKCQTYGIFDSALFSSQYGNATAGKPFYLSTASAGYIASVAGTGSQVGGVFYDSASASGAVQVFIKMK